MRSTPPGRSLPKLLVVISALLATATWHLPAAAQQFGFAALSTTAREQMYRDLEHDVEALDRELSIYKRVAKLLSPSVVHIEATPLPRYHFNKDVEEAGSGVVVRLLGNNYVLTNRHVIKHSDEDLIRLEMHDGQQLHPTRIWGDTQTDIAVLAVEGQNLVPARIGDSNRAEIGDFVLAFGSPFNLRRSVTRGIISAKGRCNLDLGEGEVIYQNFMQTDAAINPGNSGGPLVNLRGEVIGLNTAIASNSGGNDGIGFSIPINIAVRIMRQLVETGEVDRGFLGVKLGNYQDDRTAIAAGLPQRMGALVKAVTDLSPASEAQMQVNDVILRYDGTTIHDRDHLISLVKLTEVGRQVEVVLFRQGELLTTQPRIGRLNDFTKRVESSPRE